VKARPTKSKRLWQGSSWDLRVVEVALPDGSTIEKGVIDHPGSVVLVPKQGNQVLMIRQYRLALDEVIMELPAGTRGRGEDWLDCAQRELREETGYQAGTLTHLGNCWPAPGITNEVMAIYLATDLSPAPLAADPDEEISVQPVSLNDLFTMAKDGRLLDAKSVVGILRTAAFLGQL
jgi:ADP-ribose pyrophosphatase